MHESNSRHYTQSLVNAKCLQDTTLEENGIDKDGNNLAGKFFENAVGQNSLVAVMENGAFVDLLDKLSSHFNGGVFKLSENDKTELRNTDLTLLAKWLDGKLGKNNQYLLWQEYSFKYIPIELISFFYEEFLPKDENTQKKKIQEPFIHPVTLLSC